MDKLLLGWRILVRGDERKLIELAVTQFRVAANSPLLPFKLLLFAKFNTKISEKNIVFANKSVILHLRQ